MLDGVENSSLRRPYTRSIPAQLRSVQQLEESTLDVVAQWHLLVEEVISKTSPRSCDALRRLERLASQIKAVMQELTALTNEQLCVQHSTLSFEEFCSWASSPVTTYAPDIGTKLQKMQEVCLSACVVSLCIAVVMNDLELLISSMSFAQSHHLIMELGAGGFAHSRLAHRFFAPVSGNKEAEQLPDVDVLFACKLFYCLCTENGCEEETMAQQVVQQLESAENEAEDCGSLAAHRSAFFIFISHLALALAAEDYPRVCKHVARGFRDGGGRHHSPPSLLFLFTHVMFNLVVRRKLVEAKFQEVWRPVISIDTSHTSVERGGPAVYAVALCPSPGEGDVHSATDDPTKHTRYMLASAMLQRECLSVQGAWPLPFPMLERLFAVRV
ncbi:hypothetical protein ERJ75_000326600 [Trypanosoma vivax]|uniref:Uncharacterized protein n=1 Tax=Trypanosoma vivax (strain Y486) TaxID=1055687 RepID=G0UAE5_TRYVY|nr:hypothetical protein TRVL_01767 [Trypanosoma vivax]KAH8617984.1 hypothetical protein ERJ75_000326600 [Trypanosoma vivax]CCC52778.1 conserved hypothetical protein [Trypanosoma vivax Y486]